MAAAWRLMDLGVVLRLRTRVAARMLAGLAIAPARALRRVVAVAAKLQVCAARVYGLAALELMRCR